MENCNHNNVNLWVLQEHHCIVDLQSDDWAVSQDGEIKKVILATCEDCPEDLSEEIAMHLELL